MPTHVIKKSFDRYAKLSDKCIGTMRIFGLTRDRLDRIKFTCDCQINIEAGDIIYITGPSGTGKSVILNELQNQIYSDDRINLSDIKLPKTKAVVDCFSGSVLNSLKFFSTAGLADCPSMLNTPAKLSEGQQWRFRLAMALAEKKQFIFADEFCSLLDRITASTVAINIRKYADRHKITFILASAHQDILLDLSPDIIITRDFLNNTNVNYKLTSRQGH